MDLQSPSSITPIWDDIIKSSSPHFDVSHNSVTVYSVVNDQKIKRCFIIFSPTEKYPEIEPLLDQLSKNMLKCCIRKLDLKFECDEVKPIGLFDLDDYTKRSKIRIIFRDNWKVPDHLRKIQIYLDFQPPKLFLEEPPEENLLELRDSAHDLIKATERINHISTFARNPKVFAERSFQSRVYPEFQKIILNKLRELTSKYLVGPHMDIAEVSQINDILFICEYNALLKVITDIQTSTGPEFHSKFIRQLRLLSQLLPTIQSSNIPCLKYFVYFIEDLIVWFYEENEILSTFKEYFSSEFPELNQIADLGLHTAIDTFQNYLCAHPNVSVESIGTHCFSNAILNGDFPYKIYTYETPTGFRIPLIRTPSIAHHLGDNTFIPDANFIRYVIIKHARNPQLLHLLVNTMNIQHKTEHILCSNIVKLDTLPETRESVDVVSLDFSSAFFWQKGIFASVNDAGLFKRYCLAHFTSDHYYWTKSIQNLPELITIFLEITHREFFANRAELNIQERIEFNMQVNIKIINFLLDSGRYGSCSINCFSSVDRATTTLAALKVQNWKNRGIKVERRHVAKLLTKTFTPGFLLFNRNIHPERTQLTQRVIRLNYPLPPST